MLTKQLNPLPPGKGVIILSPPFQVGGLFVSEKTLSVNAHRSNTLRYIDSEVA